MWRICSLPTTVLIGRRYEIESDLQANQMSSRQWNVLRTSSPPSPTLDRFMASTASAKQFSISANPKWGALMRRGDVCFLLPSRLSTCRAGDFIGSNCHITLLDNCIVVTWLDPPGVNDGSPSHHFLRASCAKEVKSTLGRSYWKQPASHRHLQAKS